MCFILIIKSREWRSASTTCSWVPANNWRHLVTPCNEMLTLQLLLSVNVCQSNSNISVVSRWEETPSPVESKTSVYLRSTSNHTDSLVLFFQIIKRIWTISSFLYSKNMTLLVGLFVHLSFAPSHSFPWPGYIVFLKKAVLGSCPKWINISWSGWRKSCWVGICDGERVPSQCSHSVTGLRSHHWWWNKFKQLWTGCFTDDPVYAV